MSPTLARGLVAIAAGGLLAGCAAYRPVQFSRCSYEGTTYSEGAGTCQSGYKYECDDGYWRPLHIACASVPVVGSTVEPGTWNSCEFQSLAFPSGTLTCQAGSEYRCNDGVWNNLRTPCTRTAGDVPIAPIGRSCMFEGATVGSNSTICRSGVTFLCRDGEWMNLGTACR